MKLRMHDRLAEATRLAKEVDSWALLSSVVGIRVHKDGAVHLGEEEDDHISRWQYAFLNDMGGESPSRYITVIYYLDGKTPHVDKKAGNVSDTVPFDEKMIPRLENSDALVAKFHQQPGFKLMAGHHNDVIVYRMERPMAPIAILSNWKGQSIIVDLLEMDIINSTG